MIDTENSNLRYDTYWSTTQKDKESFTITRPMDFSVNVDGVATSVDFTTKLKSKTESDIEVTSFYIQDQIDVTKQLKAFQTQHIMVIADSCYSGKLLRGIQLKETQGNNTQKERTLWIDKVSKIKSRTALTSGRYLEPVLDGGGGKHSIFAKYIISNLEENNGFLRDSLVSLALFFTSPPM